MSNFDIHYEILNGGTTLSLSSRNVGVFVFINNNLS